MMNFGLDQQFPEIKRLTMQDAEDIHAYVVAESWKAYRQSNDAHGATQ